MEAIALFGLLFLMLFGINKYHEHNLRIAIAGMLTIAAVKTFGFGFKGHIGLNPLMEHLGHEWVLGANILALIFSFEVLGQYFKASLVPDWLPKILPDNWRGGFFLLLMVATGSAFLDNIASTIIGGTIAKVVFTQITIGYLAGIVACANAGGAWSVIGDTTTTMAWISGVSVLEIAPAIVGSVVNVLFVAFFAGRMQQAISPIQIDPVKNIRIKTEYLWWVVGILSFAAGVNTIVNMSFKEYADSFPWVGAAAFIGVCVSFLPIRSLHFEFDIVGLRHAVGSVSFLLCLVLSASMMPIDQLPIASILSTFWIGVFSGFLDNIPLTKLALSQGGYNWAYLCYAVGTGGSNTWFGSSAGVVASGQFPEAKNIIRWVVEGWFVPAGFLLGYLAMIIVVSW